MKYIFILMTTVFSDLFSKKIAKENLEYNKRKKIHKIFCLQRINNYGLAYNKFEGKDKFIISLTSSLIVSYSIYFFKLIFNKDMDKSLCLPLSLILGGGLGNFIDRLKNGYVTDFIYIKFKKLPIFNIADIAIVIGALIFTKKSIFKK